MPAKKTAKSSTGRGRKPAAKRSTATRKRATAKTPAAKKPTAAKQPPVRANGMLLIGVYGPFNARALVEMSALRAEELLGQPLTSTVSPTRVIDATELEIAALAKREASISDTALAAAAVALAYQIDNPFNSATSKSMCARELRETMAKLRELAPVGEEPDGIDQLAGRRANRRSSAA
jgi:hypothetical protein